MKNLTLAGRIIFALPFGIFGINHFLMVDFYIGQLTSFIPAGGFTIILTGLSLIAACISIITKRLIRLSTILLAILLLIFILTIHIPHLLQHFNTEITIIALLKDISLIGGCLMIAGMSGDDMTSATNP